MQTINWSTLSPKEREQVLARPPRRSDSELLQKVADIFDAVRKDGAQALQEFSLQFDGAEPERIELTDALIREARGAIDPLDRDALEFAAQNIRAYHEQTRPRDVTLSPSPGVTCKRVYRPIEKAGVYAPGGSAVLVSSLLMTAIPADVAGVSEIVVTTPPIKDARIKALMIFAANLCGVKALNFIGGAQAIAAMTYGAGAIPRVDKIAGPGGAWVAAAKKYAASLPGGPAMDLPAGPSELMVLADDSASPKLIAADLLSQAEHDGDAQVLFVTTSDVLAEDVARETLLQLETLPRREIAKTSLQNARMILVESRDEAIEIANSYGPEHLSIAMRGASNVAERITSAGAIFLGDYAAESFGDYNCGPSHVLPTDGGARAWSGISTETFMRAMSIQEIDSDGARLLAVRAARLARMEGLEAHARAALARLEGSERVEAAQ